MVFLEGLAAPPNLPALFAASTGFGITHLNRMSTVCYFPYQEVDEAAVQEQTPAGGFVFGFDKAAFKMMPYRILVIIVRPEVTPDDVTATVNDNYWLWLDETEETEEKPYTLSFQASQSTTNIVYQEEHKDIFEARYFLLSGEDTKTATHQIRNSFAVYSDEELARCSRCFISSPGSGE